MFPIGVAGRHQKPGRPAPALAAPRILLSLTLGLILNFFQKIHILEMILGSQSMAFLDETILKAN